MIISLNSIKQARLAGEMAQLQREDALVSLDQGEAIRRLTLINMAFLPPSFIAGVFGMNTTATQNTQIWAFAVTALSFLVVTMIFSLSGLIVRRKKMEKKHSSNSTSYELLGIKLSEWWRWLFNGPQSGNDSSPWFIFQRKRRRTLSQDGVVSDVAPVFM